MQFFRNDTDLMSTPILSVATTIAPETCEEYLSKVPRGGRTWFLALYSIYFILGVFGNGIFLLLFFIDKTLRTINNAFVINIAASDFLFVLFVAPIKFFEEYSVFRPFGRIFCVIFITIFYFSLTVSIMSMTALSYLRYRAVMRPLITITRDDQKLGQSTIIFCGISWIVGIAVAISPALHCKEITHECLLWDRHYVDSFTNNVHHLIFQLVRFVFFFLIPLLVISFFYALMVWKLCRTPSSVLMNDSLPVRKAIRSRRKLGGILLAITVIFFLSWLPNYLSPFILSNENRYIRELIDLPALSMFLPASLNPVILSMMSSKYRKPILRILFPWSQLGRYLVQRLRT